MPYTDPLKGKTTEHAEQVAFFDWAKQMEQLVPELALVFAIPGGGHRHKRVGAYMKAEGAKAGVLDVFLPVPRNNQIGMWIEFKIGRNYLSDKQKQWAVALLEQGYRVDVHYSANDAIRAICDYLGVEERFL